MTVPVSDRSVTFDEVHDAARARTAWTAMYMPAQLNDSKKISAVFSRFSGGFRGCRMSATARQTSDGEIAHGLGQEEVVVLRLNAEVLENGVGPEAFHVVLNKVSQSHGMLTLDAPSSLFVHGVWGNEGRSLCSSAQFHCRWPGRITRSI